MLSPEHELMYSQRGGTYSCWCHTRHVSVAVYLGLESAFVVSGYLFCAVYRVATLHVSAN